MRVGLRPRSSSTSSTRMCASPRAPPAPSARPMACSSRRGFFKRAAPASLSDFLAMGSRLGLTGREGRHARSKASAPGPRSPQKAEPMLKHREAGRCHASVSTAAGASSRLPGPAKRTDERAEQASAGDGCDRGRPAGSEQRDQRCAERCEGRNRSRRRTGPPASACRDRDEYPGPVQIAAVIAARLVVSAPNGRRRAASHDRDGKDRPHRRLISGRAQHGEAWQVLGAMVTMVERHAEADQNGGFEDSG